jgi:hypothetical protein
VGNWKSIDWGRPLEVWAGPAGESGHQLNTPVGRRDFMCSDHTANALIVVELKRGRPSDKVVGLSRQHNLAVPISCCRRSG